MEYLSKKISINNLQISNRLVMPPMATSKSTSDGEVTQQLCDFYKERAEGGFVGLIITEHCYVSEQGKAHGAQMSISDDKDIEGLKKLVDVIHQSGSKAFAQINHAGGAALQEITGQSAVAPSSVLHPRLKEGSDLPKELNKAEIQKIINSFAMAALRAKKAGYDGVEIHSAHGYLLNQFYSPITNKRTDEYGIATIENRVRIHLEIINAMRDIVGKEFPLAIRLGGCDYCDGGSTVEDSVKASEIFEKVGIDLLDISGGMCGYSVPNLKQPGYFQGMTEAIKSKVSVPVILTGGIVMPEDAEMLIKENKADMIGVGRAFIKDIRWAEKAFKQ